MTPGSRATAAEAVSSLAAPVEGGVPAPVDGVTPAGAATPGARLHLGRIVRFQLVAWLGTGVNLGVLWLLKGQLEVPLLWAGAIAIEVAILHNFTWHYLVTWRDRVRRSPRDFAVRLLRYNAVTAAIDLVINLAVLWGLARLGVHYLVADVAGMLVAPLFKLLANEHLIFGRGRP